MSPHKIYLPFLFNLSLFLLLRFPLYIRVVFPAWEFQTLESTPENVRNSESESDVSASDPEEFENFEDEHDDTDEEKGEEA